MKLAKTVARFGRHAFFPRPCIAAVTSPSSSSTCRHPSGQLGVTSTNRRRAWAKQSPTMTSSFSGSLAPPIQMCDDASAPS